MHASMTAGMSKPPEDDIDLSTVDPRIIAAVEAKVRADIAAAGGFARWEGSKKKDRVAEMKRIGRKPRPGRLKNLLEQPGRCACGRVKENVAAKRWPRFKGKHCLLDDPKAPDGKRPCTLADRPKLD